MAAVGHSAPQQSAAAASAAVGGSTNQSLSNRPRFCSAPSPIASAPWPPPLPNSFWSRLDEGAKYVHDTAKSFVSTYAPEKWQPVISDHLESVATRLESTFDQETRSRISDFWSTNVASNDENAPSAAWKYLIIIGATACLLLILLLLNTFLTTLALGFGLPFYAIFLTVNWFVIWRKKNIHPRDVVDQPTPKMLNFWWCGVTVVDSVIAIIVFATKSSENERWLLETALYYALPLLAFVGAKVYLDFFQKGHPSQGSKEDWSSSDEREEGEATRRFTWLLEYFLLTFAVRCFSSRGFVLLPECLRAFFGYAASYLAVCAAHKKSSKLSGLFVLSPGVGSGGSGTGVSTSPSCEHCSPHHQHGDSGAAAASGSALAAFRPTTSVPQLILPVSAGGSGGGGGGGGASARNRFHLSDSDSALRSMAAAGGRGSRRVSLPAGSLLPMKAAQSNLSEARGMLADMLAQKDLPAHLVAGLKAVSTLLVPGSKSNAALQFDFLGTLPRVIDSPYIGSDVSIESVETAAQRRHSPSVVWSTTTSATGLPTLEPEPSRARSSSYWKHKLSEGENDDGRALFKQSVDLPSKLVQLSDGTIFDLNELCRDPYLSQLKEWGLPIFDMYADTPETILSRTAYTVFQRSGLFRIFKINKQKFLSFFHALEKGYWNIPYHNRVHATDVLQAVYYFTSHKVPAFAGSMKSDHRLGSIGEQREDDDDDSSDRENDDHDNPDSESASHSKSPSAQLDDPEGTLASILSSLELMGLFTAAAMHDFDHPGRTNAFLVAIQDKKAILYNDRSVLENHHAAAAWQLLTRPENNFVEQLDPAEFKRLRYIIIEAILATDLKRHFEILMDFNGKVAKGIDWDNESEKVLASQICIKMADINSPTKPGSLHKDWTDRILEEFYAQGDEEKERGLPVSPYMDRHDAQLARLQDSFIAHLVAPLALAMNEAGLLPLTISDSNPSDPSTTAMKSELLVNLERNHKHWKVELGEDPATAVQAVPHIVPSAAKANTPGSKDEEEMETIEEGDDENGTGED